MLAITGRANIKLGMQMIQLTAGTTAVAGSLSESTDTYNHPCPMHQADISLHSQVDSVPEVQTTHFRDH